MKNMVLILVGCLISLCGGAHADWAQFLGPDRTNVSPETGLARSWPEGGGPKRLWEVSLGEGFAGASVRDGEVYVLDREEHARDIFRCLDLVTGKDLWRYTHESPGEPSYPGSRTMPTVSETHVFVVGVMGDFYCFDRKAHELVWQKNLLTDFGSGVPRWGVSQAPSLYKDLVVVAPQASGALVAAYKQATGEVVWSSESFGGVGYVSPRLTTIHGVDQAIMVTAGERETIGAVVGVSLENGNTLWRYEGWQCKIPIVSPTPLPGNRVFITGEYGAGSVMLEVVKEGEGLGVKELYKTQLCGSQIHQPILLEDHLYMNSNGNRRRDGMVCMTLDGERKWATEREPNFEKGDLLMADGLFYNLGGDSGVLHLVEPSTEGYKELASAKVLEGKKLVWAPMALSDGKLLLRDQETLRCLDLQNP